jgi:hypothetical protein
MNANKREYSCAGLDCCPAGSDSGCIDYIRVLKQKAVPVTSNEGFNLIAVLGKFSNATPPHEVPFAFSRVHFKKPQINANKHKYFEGGPGWTAVGPGVIPGVLITFEF